MYNFLREQKIKYEEISSLESFIKSDLDARELRRAVAVKMAIEGHAYRFISQLLGVSTFSIGDWKKTFKTHGIAGIKLGYKGSKKYLSAEQIAEIVQWLSDRQYWHLDELINCVDNQYGVVYKSKQSYYNLFALSNISWKRSQKTNPKFDEESVKKRQKRLTVY
jgi:putative transposase